MIEGFLVRERDGKVRIRGVDHGTLGIVLAENDDLIVIKWPGHTAWLGRFQEREYVSPEICVCEKYMCKVPRVDGTEPDPSHEEAVRLLIEWGAGRK
jgi:hypothetical protein